MNVPLDHARTMASVSMESTVTLVSVVHLSQVNTVQRSLLPVPLIHVKKEEAAVQPQTTHLTSVDVQLDGKALAVMRMLMNAKRIPAKTMAVALTTLAATYANASVDTAGTTVRQT